jgi:hypothetical protein
MSCADATNQQDLLTALYLQNVEIIKQNAAIKAQNGIIIKQNERTEERARLNEYRDKQIDDLHSLYFAKPLPKKQADKKAAIRASLHMPRHQKSAK